MLHSDKATCVCMCAMHCWAVGLACVQWTCWFIDTALVARLHVLCQCVMSAYVTAHSDWRLRYNEKNRWMTRIKRAAASAAAITMRRALLSDNGCTPLYRCQQPAQPTDHPPTHASYRASMGKHCKSQSLRRLPHSSALLYRTDTCCVAMTTLQHYLGYL